MTKTSKKTAKTAKVEANTAQAVQDSTSAQAAPATTNKPQGLMVVTLPQDSYIGAPTKLGACLIHSVHSYMYLRGIKGTLGEGKDRNGNKKIATILAPMPRVKMWVDKGQVQVKEATQEDIDSAILLANDLGHLQA